MAIIDTAERIIIKIGEIPSKYGVNPVDLLADVGRASIDKAATVYIGADRATRLTGWQGEVRQRRAERANEEILNLLSGIARGTIALAPFCHLCLEEIIDHLPEKEREALARSLGVSTGKTLARMAAMRQLKRAAAEKMAALITRVVRNALGKELLVSGAALRTGFAAPVAILNAVGLTARSEWGADALLFDNPRLYRQLSPHGYQYLYFLVEPYIGNIIRYTGPRPKNPGDLEKVLDDIHEIFG